MYIYLLLKLIPAMFVIFLKLPLPHDIPKNKIYQNSAVSSEQISVGGWRAA